MKLEIGKRYVCRNDKITSEIEETEWRELAYCNELGLLWNICDGTHGDASASIPCIKNIPDYDIVAEYEE